MDILTPGKNYIDFRCATHGKEGQEFEEAKRKFFKAFPCEEEIKAFSDWLRKVRGNLTLPVERIEIREGDHLRHGNLESMMIWDIEYWREDGQIKRRKIYARLNPYDAGAKRWVKDPNRPPERPFWHRPDCPYMLCGWDGNLKWNCCRRILTARVRDERKKNASSVEASEQAQGI